MWKRWNQTTHIHEMSTNNGASWAPMPLNAAVLTEGTIAVARLPANVAYKDQDNYLVAQHIADGTTIEGPNGLFYLNANAAPVGGKRARFVNYGDNNFRFEWLSDDATSVTSTPLQMTTNGNIFTAANLYVGNNVNLAGAVYEASRNTPMGYYIDVPFNAGNFSASSGTLTSLGQTTFSYAFVGKTAHIAIYLAFIPSVATTRFYITLPFGLGARSINAPFHYYQAGVVAGASGLVQTYSGTNYLDCLRDIVGTPWQPQQTYVSINMSVSIV